MRQYIKEAWEEIDASVFVGDAFLDSKHREELRKYMAFWESQLKTYDVEL